MNLKVYKIKQLIKDGKANDVLSLMEGESPYTTEDSEGVPKDRMLARIWIGALHHLRFISEFGIDAKAQKINGKLECPLPDIFEQWLQAGAPGIGENDLDNYLQQRNLDKKIKP